MIEIRCPLLERRFFIPAARAYREMLNREVIALEEGWLMRKRPVTQAEYQLYVIEQPEM